MAPADHTQSQIPEECPHKNRGPSLATVGEPLPQIFVVYTDRDGNGKRFAFELKSTLSQKGYNTFVFDHSKREHLGTELWYLLSEEIAKRQTVIVVCTQAINESRGARFEISHALERDKQIIPLKFDDAPVPDPISIYIRENFAENNCKAVFAALARNLPKSHREHEERRLNIRQETEDFGRGPSLPLKIVTTPAGGQPLLDTIAKAYHRDTVVEHVSILENFDKSLHSKLAFGQIGLRVPIDKEWIGNPSHYVIVDDIGRSVALGEKNYLTSLWKRHARIETFPMNRFDFRNFTEILRQLSLGMYPQVLFAPIDMYVKFMKMMLAEAQKGIQPIRWGEGETFLVSEEGKELRMFWSNRGAPSDHFALIDRSATSWCVKPDSATGNRLTTVFVDNKKNPLTKIDFLVKTVVAAQVTNPAGVKLFKFG